MVDMLYPQTGVSVVAILEHLGIEVNFPMGQTCCGQPAFNAGFRDDARTVARQFLTAFADAEVIVAPSGSCVAMVRHYYPELFQDDPEWYDRAVQAASITWELTEYLVDGLGITDLDAAMPPTRVAFHDACHGLRLLGLKEQSRQLVGSIEGVTTVKMDGADQCCGFGGLFAVKMPAISGAMLKDKITQVETVEADVILTGDASCLTQINGGLSRNEQTRRIVHVADFLAEALRRRQD
jgi:L-lactate dehydrogenase complex protein LldE